VCTVLLRYDPAAAWPLLLGAVRDEFVERPWDPPAAYWGGRVLGGRDRLAGGTWLAVDPDAPAVAAVLNGAHRLDPSDPGRLSRGALPLAALAGEPLPDPATLARYDGFHLLLGTPAGVDVWTWDGVSLAHRVLPPGDHILVNAGVDAATDPLVPHFAPLLARTPAVAPEPGLSTVDAWRDWVGLLAGGGLEPSDPRALVVRAVHAGHEYGSTSASLVGLSRTAARYDFTGTPGAVAYWTEVRA
jgi:Transport and Golgi organisation 2